MGSSDDGAWDLDDWTYSQVFDDGLDTSAEATKSGLLDMQTGRTMIVRMPILDE
jgi:hypothetical protein